MSKETKCGSSYRGLSAFKNFGGNPPRDGKRRYVFGDDGTSGKDGIASDGNSRRNDDPPGNPDVVFDGYGLPLNWADWSIRIGSIMVARDDLHEGGDAHVIANFDPPFRIIAGPVTYDDTAGLDGAILAKFDIALNDYSGTNNTARPNFNTSVARVNPGFRTDPAGWVDFHIGMAQRETASAPEGKLLPKRVVLRHAVAAGNPNPETHNVISASTAFSPGRVLQRTRSPVRLKTG